MKVNEELDFRYYPTEDDHVTYPASGNFTRLLFYSGVKLTSFIIPHITVEKFNWRCKGCGEKIRDPIQIISYESHNPSYHVSCWEQISVRVISTLLAEKENLMKQIDQDIRQELTENIITRTIENE